MRFFELSLLADQSLVQAGWVESVPPALLEETVKLLAAAPVGRTVLRDRLELQWAFEPARGIATLRNEGRVVLLHVLVRGDDAEADAALLATWIAELRRAPPIQKLHGDDPEAFEVIRRMRHRPLSATVLLPEGTMEENKALLDFHRAVAMAAFTARWA